MRSGGVLFFWDSSGNEWVVVLCIVLCKEIELKFIVESELLINAYCL